MLSASLMNMDGGYKYFYVISPILSKLHTYFNILQIAALEIPPRRILFARGSLFALLTPNMEIIMLISSILPISSYSVTISMLDLPFQTLPPSISITALRKHHYLLSNDNQSDSVTNRGSAFLNSGLCGTRD